MGTFPSHITQQLWGQHSLSHHFRQPEPASVFLSPAGTRGDTGSSWRGPG